MITVIGEERDYQQVSVFQNNVFFKVSLGTSRNQGKVDICLFLKVTSDKDLEAYYKLGTLFFDVGLDILKDRNWKSTEHQKELHECSRIVMKFITRELYTDHGQFIRLNDVRDDVSKRFIKTLVLALLKKEVKNEKCFIL